MRRPLSVAILETAGQDNRSEFRIALTDFPQHVFLNEDYPTNNPTVNRQELLEIFCQFPPYLSRPAVDSAIVDIFDQVEHGTPLGPETFKIEYFAFDWAFPV